MVQNIQTVIMKIIADRVIVSLDNQPPPLSSVCILVTASYTSPPHPLCYWRSC